MCNGLDSSSYACFPTVCGPAKNFWNFPEHDPQKPPCTNSTVRTLKEAGASAEVLEKAAAFRCIHCEHRKHAQPHRTSQVPHATRKWETVSVDTFWWHSPHKDEKGNPSEHVVGVSFLDEASDFHVATIVRTGTSKQGSISAGEFKAALAKDWLRNLPKPGCIRFDDEGAFRDQKLIEWIEAQAIRVSVIAGEAAWQVGKHSRHLEVLKENMSLLSSELGSTVKSEELLALSLAAKNEMHNIKGYSPNQWVFGQDKTRVQSYLQNGSNLATTSLRERSETFEESLERSNQAQQTFLKADSRRRVLRAARGRARKHQTFEVGQLVYFYRKGRNNTSRFEAGWHGPARVLAIEKQGSTENNQAQGSIVWIVHATVLYRCAPEQLRDVPQSVQETYGIICEPLSPLEELRRAGNRANYRDISQDLCQEPEDSEIHDLEPQVRGSAPGISSPPARRITGKRSTHGPEQQAERAEPPREDDEQRQEEDQRVRHGPGDQSDRGSVPQATRRGDSAQSRNHRGVRTDSGELLPSPGQSVTTGQCNVRPEDADEFFRAAAVKRHQQPRHGGHPDGAGARAGHGPGRDGQGHEPQGDLRGMPAADLGPQRESRPARADQPGLPADNVPVPRADHVPPGAPGGDPTSNGGSRSREPGPTSPCVLVKLG